MSSVFWRPRPLDLAGPRRTPTEKGHVVTNTTTTAEGPECRKHGPMVLRAAAHGSDLAISPTWDCRSEVCHNTVLHPAKDAERKGTIEITHTRADGTLLSGSRKGDGVWEIVRGHGFRSFRSLGCLGVQQSRDKAAKRWYINSAAEALRTAGWTVEIDIDEDVRRTFAEAEEDRVERAEERTERFEGYADNAASRSEAHRGVARQIARGIPFGQPILVGHHSEGRARRDAERIDTNMRKGIAEGKKSDHYAHRAAAAGAYEKFRKSPGVTLRRIAKLEADLRRVEKWLSGESAGGYTEVLTPAREAELNRRKEELTEELEYWRHVIAKAEADGFKVWGKADFKKGDFARYHGAWYEVLRVNVKSLTVPHIHNGVGRTVVRKGDGHLDWTWTAPYDGVKGRRTAEEMAAAEAKAAAKAAGEQSASESPAEAPAEAEKPARFAVTIEADDRKWMRFHERDRAVACAASYGLGEDHVKDTWETAPEDAGQTPVMHEDRFLPLDR